MGFHKQLRLARAVCGALAVWTGASLAAGNPPAAPVSTPVAAPVSARFAETRDAAVRLQLETRVGIVRNMALSPRGDVIRIDFQGATREEVNAIASALHKSGPVVAGARAVFVSAQDAYIHIDLARPLDLLDHTLVAAPGDRSRWEMVLTDAAKAAVAKAAELRDLQLVSHDDLLDIRISGSPDLMAEVSVLDGPSRVVVDLPGATPASVERYAQGYRPGPVPFVKRVTASVDAGVPRLVFELYEDVDLVDSDGVIKDGQGTIRISLARDAAAVAGGSSLRAVTAQLGARQVDVNLQGVDPDKVRSYALAEPPRVVMDLLGVPPEQAKAAVAGFKAPHPGILGARVEATRLGSARLVFDLATPIAVVARNTLRPAATDAYGMAVRVPANPNEAGFVRPGVVVQQPLPVSVSQRGPRVDSAAPLLVIRPVTLGPLPATTSEALPADAAGLMGLYARSLQQDPKFAGIRKDYDVVLESVPQARAALLPSVVLDYQRSNVNQNVTRASNAAFPTGETSYPNKNLSLTITQPLLKMPAITRLDQAQRSVEQARFNLMAGEQDLILRLATSYLNVAAAHDGLELAEAESATTEKQLELAKARLSNGLGNITQVHDAQARFSLAKAKALEARNRVDDADQALREIVGSGNAVKVKGFKGDFAASGPVPAQVAPWVTAATEQNLGLLSRKIATEIAELEITRQKGAFAPNVNLTASSTRVDTGGSLYGAGQAYNNRELGVRVNVPLFEGGATASAVREATARLGKAQSEYDQELRHSERVARAAFSSVLASIESQDALRQAVVAQQSALEAREEGLKSGLYTPVMVIDAYRLYYAAKRDYLQARYDYLVNRLKLKQAVGILSRNDLEDLNALLAQ